MRLTSLLGAIGKTGVCPSIGAPEPCEKAIDELGPALESSLPCWDKGLDNLLSQEAFDENESRGVSAMV